MRNDIVKKNAECYYNLVKEGIFEGLKLPENITKETPKIYNTLKEFDSDVFLLLVVGAAKSGKSTLVNLLLDEPICKTGMGETTKRPAIYIPTDDKNGSILIFYRGVTCVSSTDDPEQLEVEKGAMVDDIISYARGVKSLDELRNAGIRINKRPYSVEEAQKLVTIDRLKCGDPLLVLVKIPCKDSLINSSNGIRLAVVDMPGLDGVVSTNLDYIEYKRLSQKADYVLFVEGSMTALNKESARFIKENLPLRNMHIKLVENLFDSIWWSDPKLIEEQLNAKIGNSIATLKDDGLLNVSHDILNLRLAAEVEELKNPSHSQEGFRDTNEKAKKDFQVFMSELSSELYQNGKLSKENASASELRSIFNKISTATDCEIAKLRDKIKIIDGKMHDELNKNFPKVGFSDIDVQGKMDELLRELVGELDNLFTPKRELSGKELKSKISEEKARVCKQISKLVDGFFNKFSLKVDIPDLINRKIRSIYPDCDGLFKGSDIDDSRLRDIESALKLKREIAEIFDAVIDRIKEKKVVIRNVSFWTKIYKQDAIDKIFSEIKDESKCKIEKNKRYWREIVAGVIRAIFDNAENKYKEICDGIKMQKYDCLKSEKTKLENSLNSYKKLKNIIDAR